MTVVSPQNKPLRVLGCYERGYDHCLNVLAQGTAVNAQANARPLASVTCMTLTSCTDATYDPPSNYDPFLFTGSEAVITWFHMQNLGNVSPVPVVSLDLENHSQSCSVGGNIHKLCLSL